MSCCKCIRMLTLKSTLGNSNGFESWEEIIFQVLVLYPMVARALRQHTLLLGNMSVRVFFFSLLDGVLYRQGWDDLITQCPRQDSQ